MSLELITELLCCCILFSDDTKSKSKSYPYPTLNENTEKKEYLLPQNIKRD